MLAALLCTFLATPHVEVNENAIAPRAGLPSIPWLGHGAASFDGAPLATVGTGDPSAQIWVATDANALRLHLEVHDATHVNVRQDNQIWDGDSVQIGIDARGHGAAGMAVDTDFAGIGDLYAAFALTQKGVQGWAHLRGAPDAPGALNTPSRIVRDETRGVTVYDIALPWDMLHTIPAAFDTLGVSVQINDADPGRATQTRLQWGGGPSGTLRPGLLHTLAYEAPPAGYVDAMVANSELWQPSDAPEVIVVNHAVAAPAKLTSRLADTENTVTLATTPVANRLHVHLNGAPWNATPQPWRVVLKRADDTQRTVDTAVQAPPLSFAELGHQLATLQAAADDALVKMHVRNVSAMLQQAWQSALTLQPGSAEAAMDVLHTAQHVVPALTQACKDAAAFHTGDRVLLGTFVSPDDGTLQPYTVRLPRHEDPNTPHPLIVFLHGKGDPQVTHYVDNAVTSTGTPEDDAIVLAPWGRGITGYRGLAERDVLVALEQVRAQFNVDANRVYLAGFSMGGAGAWSIALHDPAPWAAVSIASGGTWLTSLGVGLGGNVKDLPLQIWHGDADGTVDVGEALRMRDELKRSGIQPNVTLEHGAGHTFNDARWRSMVEWLLPHKRNAAKAFTYVSDDFIHRGRNGVKMRRDTAVSAFPKVRVRVEGANVFINSTGTQGLDVDLGPRGLDLQGTVTVIWNGKKVFTGDPTVVTLGIGGGKR